MRTARRSSLLLSQTSISMSRLVDVQYRTRSWGWYR